MGESGIHPKWWIHSCHWEVLQQSHIQGDEDEDEIESEWWSVLCRRASQYRPSLRRLMLIDLVMYRIDVGKIWKDVEGRFHAKSIERLPHCEAQSDDARWAFTLFLGGASIMHPGVTIAIGAKRHLPGALGWHGWEQSAEWVVIYHWFL